MKNTMLIRKTALLCTLLALLVGTHPASAQTSAGTNQVARPARPTPPTRDPHTPGYVAATELPDGATPPVTAEGNFILGPTHDRAPEMTVQTNILQGKVYD